MAQWEIVGQFTIEADTPDAAIAWLKAELAAKLAPGATVDGDKGDNSAPDERWRWEEAELRLVPRRKRNMWPNEWDDALALQEERHTIETVNSQFAAMGIQCLHVRSVAGLELKVHGSLLALTCARAA